MVKTGGMTVPEVEKNASTEDSTDLLAKLQSEGILRAAISLSRNLTATKTKKVKVQKSGVH